MCEDGVADIVSVAEYGSEADAGEDIEVISLSDGDGGPVVGKWFEWGSCGNECFSVGGLIDGLWCCFSV